jgi:hypothetical protein
MPRERALKVVLGFAGPLVKSTYVILVRVRGWPVTERNPIHPEFTIKQPPFANTL